MFQYVKADTVGLGIEASIKALNDFGHIEERENQDRKDTMKEIQLCLDIENPLAEPTISRCIFTDIKGLASYDHEMLDGTADDKGWKYTYHQLYNQFYDDLINELKRDIHTRRARISLGAGNPELIYSSDPPCFIEMLFNYVNDKLEMTVIFRSNDAIKAFPMNIHAISMLHIKIANELNVEVGSMHYIANNFHCYSRDFNLLEQYCKQFETASYKRRFFSMEDLKKYY